VHVVGQADRLEAVLSLSDEGEPLGTAKYRARSEAEWGLVIDDDDGKFGVRGSTPRNGEVPPEPR
jgi:hypothetical protein